MKKGLLSLLLFALVGVTVWAVEKDAALPPQYRLRTIVLDAGHGGVDVGAKGQQSYEKEIALDVTRKLGRLLIDSMPELKVVFTRTDDVTQHVTIKAKIANEARGDLFVSIHCNSAEGATRREQVDTRTETYYTGKGKKRKKKTRTVPVYRYYKEPSAARGTETYIWGVDKNDEKESMMRENESLYLDSTLAKQVADFNPNDPEKRVLYALKTKQYFTRSASLAMSIEDEFAKIGRVSRGAKQRGKGIWVLQATAMPSVLVELGYISNPSEESYMVSEEGQWEMARTIYRALKRYKYSLENHLIEQQAPMQASNP